MEPRSLAFSAQERWKSSLVVGTRVGRDKEGAGSIQSVGLSSKAPRASPALSPTPIHLEDLTLSLLLHILLGQEVLQATPEKGGSACSGQHQGYVGHGL